MKDASEMAAAIAAAFNFLGLVASPGGLQYLRRHNTDEKLKTGILEAARTCVFAFEEVNCAPAGVDIPQLLSLLNQLTAPNSLLDFEDPNAVHQLEELLRSVLRCLGVELPPAP